MAFTYPTIATDSNYHALALEITRNGQPMAMLGSAVSITIKDRDTRDVIVPEGTPVNAVADGRWEFWFDASHVALIERNSIWLVEWKLTYGAYVWRLPEPAELPVRKKL